jgi:hypothetical protein
MQKPFSNERKPEPPPQQPAPAKKGGFFGKLVKLVIFATVAGAVVTMAMHARKIGEDRAIAQKGAGETDEQARMKAAFVPPWQWTSTEWDGYATWITTLGKQAGSTISARAQQLKSKGEEFIAEWKQKQAANATSTTSTTSGASATATQPKEAGAGAAGKPAEPPLPEGFNQAAELVREGNLLWQDNKLAEAKPKLEEAVKLLKPMAEKKPAHPMVEKALDLAQQLLEDIAAR